jgi:hypothetical protein
MTRWIAKGVLAAALAGCSAGGATSSGDLGGSSGSSGSSSGSSAGASTSDGGGSAAGSSSGSSGPSAGGATGAGGSSGSPGASSTSGSGSGSGSSSGSNPSGGGTDGGAAVVRGCGQGTSCTPGTDLPPPAPGQGFQIATPAGAIAVQPGQESFLCYYKTLPNTAELDVGTMQSWMTPGSSHHFIAYQITGGVGATPQADGTLIPCAFGGGTWMYATSLPGEIIELKMPDGVGLPLPASTQVMLNMHFINPGTTTAYPQVKMNFIAAPNVQYKAAAMVSFNTSIDVPPATANGPGTQTVGGTCTAPVGSKFFDMTTHTHKHAVSADVNYVSGGQTTNIVHTTDWEHPDVGLWNAPDFLTVRAGDSFTYSCSYTNTGSTAVTVGETAASNEMCMAIGYYFPAGNASCR